jgi:ribosomal protein S5
MGRSKKFSPEKTKEFNRRLLKIDTTIPKDFIKKVLEVNPTLSINRIQNVRYNGKVIDFEILKILEKICKPIIEAKEAKEKNLIS